MIFITAKFPVLARHADDWPDITREFTRATRAEPGCLWFTWSRGVDDSTEYVLVEAFRDGGAGADHVNSAHFAKARAELPRYLARTPDIVHTVIDGEEWASLDEFAVPSRNAR